MRASNRGDRDTATVLAGQVLAVDRGNPEAEDLLASFDWHGEIRRLALARPLGRELLLRSFALQRGGDRADFAIPDRLARKWEIAA